MANSEWLQQTKEATIEPDLPICDPHHHLWDHPGSRYLMDEILADTGSGHHVTHTVFVECASAYRGSGAESLRPVGETEFVEAIAVESASGRHGSTRVASGIVSHADLTLGEAVRPVLEAHFAASPSRFRGIRHATGWHADSAIRNSHSNPPENLMLDENFRRGFAVLADMGLSFDAWFYHSQTDEFVDLARQFPAATIILDHFGGPLGIGPYEGKQDEVFGYWKDHIDQLADLPNVYFKLGGINMKVNGFGWHRHEQPPGSDDLVSATAYYYLHCIETFGPDRCMFESNFPVDKDSCSYNVLWNAFKKMTASMDADARAKLFHDTAMKVYRLD